VFAALFLFGSTLNIFSIIGIIMLMGSGDEKRHSDHRLHQRGGEKW
jgi:hypothetical protein